MTAEQRARVKLYVESKQSRHRRPIDGEKVQCEECGSTENLEWHHMIHWSLGGDDSPDNLRVLCHSCHWNIHLEQDDFRKAGQWGGLVSAYLREKRLGREKFCEEMRELSLRRWAA